MNKLRYKLDIQNFAESSVSLTIVNGIRSDIGGAYAERIPEATRDNISLVGNTILTNKERLNDFFSALLNRISRTTIKHADDVEDIYSAFGGEEELAFGDTIQKIFIDIPSAHQFVGAETEHPEYMLKTEKGEIYVEYTSVDRKIFYKTTISVPQLKEAFLSVDKLDAFIQGLISGMARALSYDKYLMDTELLKVHCNYVKLLAEEDDAKVNCIVVPEDVVKYNKTTGLLEWGVTGAKAFLKILKKATSGIKFPHKLSFAGYDQVDGEIINTEEEPMKTISMIRTPKSRQVLALEVDTMAEVDVDALAVLFHLEPANISTQTIEIENGAMGLSADGNTYFAGFLCDRDLVERGKSFEDTDSFKNPENEYVNLWNHYWGYRAVSKFGDFLPICVTAYTPQEPETNGAQG